MKRIIITLSALALFSCTALSQTLRETVGKHFLIGTALNTRQVNGQDSQEALLATRQFNAVVAENCMKPEEIEPEEGKFQWSDADKFVQFAADHNLTATGHVLVWHSQTAPWMFQDKYGQLPNRELMIQRMRDYIHTVVGHFKGKVRGWDVVNEAIEDDGSLRKSPWLRAIGPEYIRLAFQFAHEADPDAELYYNDFSMSKPGKRQTVVKLIRELKAAGCRIDAVGMQSHNGLDYPSLDEYEKSMKAFINEGVNVMITELDVNVLPNPEDFSGADIAQNFQLQQKYNPYPKKLPKEVRQQFDNRYLDFFRLYRKYADHITRVTLWGVTDGNSWLNDWPIKGRTNYPLLFDRNCKPKPVVKQIVEMFND